MADVLRIHWSEVVCHPHINSWQLRTLGAIKRCRTAEMGGHVDACTSCGTVRVSYNSCRNRHCPKCQGRQRELWMEKREEELLPVPYFHVVFTLPDLLNEAALRWPRLLYDTLFEAAWDTLYTFSSDHKYLGAKSGMIAILHTWGQTLSLHPHLHCIVPSGGLTKAGFWKHARTDGKFLFPVKAMSIVYRAKFMEKLRSKISLDPKLISDLFKKQWIVYAKRPFGGPLSVLEYLGRYTHKIAISNHRISGIDNNTVSFSYKDYRKGGAKQEMTLDGMEFVRRFAMHILPKGFVRIRHYGILSSTTKKVSIPSIRNQLQVQLRYVPTPKVAQAYNPHLCPCCNTETMVTIEIISKRGPPKFPDIRAKDVLY